MHGVIQQTLVPLTLPIQFSLHKAVVTQSWALVLHTSRRQSFPSWNCSCWWNLNQTFQVHSWLVRVHLKPGSVAIRYVAAARAALQFSDPFIFLVRVLPLLTFPGTLAEAFRYRMLVCLVAVWSLSCDEGCRFAHCWLHNRSTYWPSIQVYERLQSMSGGWCELGWVCCVDGLVPNLCLGVVCEEKYQRLTQLLFFIIALTSPLRNLVVQPGH
jgi:hypothetical protein